MAFLFWLGLGSKYGHSVRITGMCLGLEVGYILLAILPVVESLFWLLYII